MEFGGCSEDCFCRWWRFCGRWLACKLSSAMIFPPWVEKRAPETSEERPPNPKPFPRGNYARDYTACAGIATVGSTGSVSGAAHGISITPTVYYCHRRTAVRNALMTRFVLCRPVRACSTFFPFHVRFPSVLLVHFDPFLGLFLPVPGKTALPCNNSPLTSTLIRSASFSSRASMFHELLAGAEEAPNICGETAVSHQISTRELTGEHVNMQRATV